MGHGIINYFGSEGQRIGGVCYRKRVNCEAGGEIRCVRVFPLIILDMCLLIPLASMFVLNFIGILNKLEHNENK